MFAFLFCVISSFPAHAQNLKFNDLQSFLVAQKISSVEEALPPLVAKYPDYFIFHTLMYASLSLQESSFKEPRAIVFGSDAKFVLTFNGGVHQRGGDSFESVEYADHEFKFRQIAFKYPSFDRTQLRLDPSEIAFENDKLVISTANPKKCTQCHGEPANPIWSPYFLWQGAYGSDDDQLYMSFDRDAWNPNNEVFFKTSTSPQSQGRLMRLAQGQADTELEGMIKYIQGRPAHPRYKSLPKSFIEDGILAHAAGTPFDQLDYSAAATQEQNRLNASYEWPSRPNGFLLTALSDLNQERLIWKLSAMGLKNAFASSWWKDLFKFPFNKLAPESPTMWSDLAAELNRGLAQFKFNGPRPSQQEIEDLLKENFRSQIETTQRLAMFHTNMLLPSQLEFFWYPGQTDFLRFGQEWMGDPVKFYAQFLGISEVTEADKIAFFMESDDQIQVTALQILLKDHGVDLHDYSLSFRHKSLSFHTSGLDQVFQFLGM